MQTTTLPLLLTFLTNVWREFKVCFGIRFDIAHLQPQLYFSLFIKALIFLSSYFSLFIDAIEEEPRAGPHKFIRVEVFVEVHSYFSFFAESPFPTGGVGVGGVFYRSPNAKRLRSLVIRVRKLIDSLINVMPQGGDHRLGWGGEQTYNFGVKIPHTRANVLFFFSKFLTMGLIFREYTGNLNGTKVGICLSLRKQRTFCDATTGFPSK